LPADLLEKVKAAAIAEDLPYTIFIRRVLRKALQKTSRSQAA
jgi:predicted DNA binding CopG/RHH family protein